MHPELTDDQQLIVDQVEQFVKGQIAAQAAGWFHQEESAHEGLAALGEQGLLGFRVPESEGGPELDPVILCRSLSVIAQTDASLATMAAILNGLVIEYLLQHDTTAHRAARLESLISGEQWAAWVSPDLLPSTDIRPAILAQSEGDGWILDGEARFVTLGATAQHLLLFASTPKAERLAFWLDANTPGIERQIVRGKLGLRHTDVAHIRLHGVTAGPQDSLGPATSSNDSEQHIWRCGQLCLAAVSLGIAQAAHKHACDYAQQRRQFGKALASFQAIQWKIADVGMALEAGQALIDKAATLWQADDREAFAIWSQTALTYNARAAVSSAQEALQIHGGYGFTTEFPIERFYRDAQTLRARWFDEAHAHEQIAIGPWHHQI